MRRPTPRNPHPATAIFVGDPGKGAPNVPDKKGGQEGGTKPPLHHSSGWPKVPTQPCAGTGHSGEGAERGTKTRPDSGSAATECEPAEVGTLATHCRERASTMPRTGPAGLPLAAR